MHEDPPRDASERNVRIGCGTLLGLFIACVIGFQTYPSWTTWALIAIACVAICAWLAVRYGDSFWHKVLDLLRWW